MQVKVAERYVVDIAVPPDSPVRNVPFHFEMAATHDPDELFDKGPIVSGELPERGPNGGVPKWVWGLIAGVVLLLIVGGGAAWYFTRDHGPVVGSYVGRPLEEAKNEIENDLHAAAVITLVQTPASVGQVVAQKPNKGEPLPETKVIALDVGENPFAKIPNLVGKTLTEAQDLIAKEHLVIGAVQNDLSAAGAPTA